MYNKLYRVQCSRCLGWFYTDAPLPEHEEYICDHCCLGNFEPKDEDLCDYEDFERGFIS